MSRIEKSKLLSESFKSMETKPVSMFQPLEFITSTAVNTAAAAYYLNRQQQTLRAWACKTGTGPLLPLRIHGRLAWPTAELRRLLGVAA